MSRTMARLKTVRIPASMASRMPSTVFPKKSLFTCRSVLSLCASLP